MTSREVIENYRSKYGMTVSQCAKELGISESAIARYSIQSKNMRTPSTTVLRAIQLLDFIKQQGLEPPQYE